MLYKKLGYTKKEDWYNLSHRDITKNKVSNWASPEEQYKNDVFKEKCANDNGYSVIRILQEDVFNDTYDWLGELCKAIEELKNGDDIGNIYLGGKEYDKFMLL